MINIILITSVESKIDKKTIKAVVMCRRLENGEV